MLCDKKLSWPLVSWPRCPLSSCYCMIYPRQLMLRLIQQIKDFIDSDGRLYFRITLCFKVVHRFSQAIWISSCTIRFGLFNS